MQKRFRTVHTDVSRLTTVAEDIPYCYGIAIVCSRSWGTTYTTLRSTTREAHTEQCAKGMILVLRPSGFRGVHMVYAIG